MGRNADDAALLRALTRLGGRVPIGRLAMHGLLAANRLVRKQLACLDKEAEGGWVLVLTRREDNTGDQEGARGHHPVQRKPPVDDQQLPVVPPKTIVRTQ
jgi:hypothetical protein